MAPDSEITRANIATYDNAWSRREYARGGLMPIESAAIARWFPPAPAWVLDLGCGAGRTTGSLAALGYRVVGLDLSAGLLGEARRLHPGVPFVRADARVLPFAPAAFDAALFSYNGIDCIHPVAGRLACLAEVRRVLRPGGVFLLSSHNLLGALFSGGYHYLRGYLNAVRLLVDQRSNRELRRWYVRYRDGGGEQLLYSAPPRVTLSQLARAGFIDVVAFAGAGDESVGFLTRRCQHVQFAARRP
jgi:SAM-dependent methyltransferase